MWPDLLKNIKGAARRAATDPLKCKKAALNVKAFVHRVLTRRLSNSALIRHFRNFRNANHTEKIK